MREIEIIFFSFVIEHTQKTPVQWEKVDLWPSATDIKSTVLKLDFEDPVEKISIAGTIVSADLVEGRKDIVAASISFEEAKIPLAYKLHINNFVTAVRKNQLPQQGEQAQSQK